MTVGDCRREHNPRTCLIIVAFLLMGHVAGCNGEVPQHPWPPTSAAARGYNIACYERGCLDSPTARATLARARALGARDVALVVTYYVDDATRGVPSADPQRTAPLAELEIAAAVAKGLGLRVVVKPHVDRRDDGSRTHIEPSDLETWWRAYRGYVHDAAESAERVGARAFVVGTELAGLSRHEARWRALIADVRARFSGRVTYAANWDELERLRFFDALDDMAVDAYYPLAHSGAPAFDLVRGWRAHLARLAALRDFDKTRFIVSETGAPSADTLAQARWYRAALFALRDVGGVFLWNLWQGDGGGTYVSGAAAQGEVAAVWAR